jgi:PX domain
VCNAKNTWVIFRTWNDFRDLHGKLEKQLPSIKLPRLPPSKFFGVMDPSFVKQRKTDLEKYSARLAAIPSVCRSELFQFFLQPMDE